VQGALNAKLLLLPARADAVVPDDPFLKSGAALLGRTQHLAQYFDRDAVEELATVAMKGFQEFMLYPDRIDSILDAIERVRSRLQGR
jgi:multiple sugar transport system substrate-binding protein